MWIKVDFDMSVLRIVFKVQLFEQNYVLSKQKCVQAQFVEGLIKRGFFKENKGHFFKKPGI